MSNQQSKPRREYHHLHVRLDLLLWKRLRRAFPEYGHIRLAVNRAVLEFITKWEASQDGQKEDS